MKRDRVSVVGHINLDRELYLESFPRPGVSVSVRGREEHLGGCAATISLTAARLGGEVSLFSVVGRDFPQRYLKELSSAGVDCRGLMVLDGPSPYCLILNAPGEEQGYIMFQGVSELEEVLERSTDLLNARILVLTSGLPSFHSRLAEEASRGGSVVVFDPTQEIHYRWGAEELRRAVASSHYIFMNELEYGKMREMLREDPFTLSSNLSMMIVTSGEKGYRTVDREGERRFPAVRAPGGVITPTGAGDVMRGGFVAGLLKGLPPHLAVRLGAAAASLAICRKQGVGRYPALEEVTEWLRALVEGGEGEEVDVHLLSSLIPGSL